MFLVNICSCKGKLFFEDGILVAMFEVTGKDTDNSSLLSEKDLRICDSTTSWPLGPQHDLFSSEVREIKSSKRSFHCLNTSVSSRLMTFS